MHRRSGRATKAGYTPLLSAPTARRSQARARMARVGFGIYVGGMGRPATSDTGFLAAVAFSPDGRLLAVAGSGGVVSLFHLPDLELPILLMEQASRVRALAFSPQGDMLASGAEDQQINIWRPRMAHILRLSPVIPDQSSRYHSALSVTCLQARAMTHGAPVEHRT